MGLVKKSRTTDRDAPQSRPPAAADWRDYHLAGVRFTRYRKRPDQVNVTRLAANDPGTWAQVWGCIKRSRPQLAALLMDPQLAALQTYFDADGVTVDFTIKPEVDMYFEAYYIDTRDGANGMFVPPPKVADYAAWLRAQYQACQGTNGNKILYFGLAQRVNALIAQSRKLQEDKSPPRVVRLIGPHAQALRDYLAEVSNGLIEAEVVV